MTRPDHIGGRPPLLTAEQVAQYRAEHALRRRVLRETRSLQQMADDAGLRRQTMLSLLNGETYKWVR